MFRTLSITQLYAKPNKFETMLITDDRYGPHKAKYSSGK